MLGKITQKDYMHEVIRQYPEWKAEIKKCFAPRYQSQVVPIIRENLDYILSLKPKYKLYILSNLTDATYRYLRKVLQNFDGGIYSFQAHVKKPDPEIYQMLFQKYNLNPAECIFFDDRKANLEAGEKLGMRGVQVRSLDDIKSVNLS